MAAGPKYAFTLFQQSAPAPDFIPTLRPTLDPLPLSHPPPSRRSVASASSEPKRLQDGANSSARGMTQPVVLQARKDVEAPPSNSTRSSVVLD